MERPSPVPSPGGWVVKNGVKIFAFTSAGMPVPLSRMRISTLSLRLFVAADNAGSKPLAASLPRLLVALKPFAMILSRTRVILRVHIGRPRRRIKIALQSDVEAGLLRASAVIGEIGLSLIRALISTGRCLSIGRRDL